MIPRQFYDQQIWLKLLGIILLTWLALFLKKWLFTRALRRVQPSLHMNPLSLQVMGRVGTVLISFIGTLLFLQTVGINIWPILTLSGIGAAAVAYAGKDAIANFFGGMMMSTADSFGLCDFIELPDKKIKGNVEEIGWYFTTLRDLQKRPIYLPNSLFTTELLINHSRMTHRYLEEKIRIKEKDAAQTQLLLEEIRKLFREQKEIDADLPIDVFLLSISPYGLEIELKAYTRLTQYEEYMAFKEKILLAIYRLGFERQYAQN